MRSRARSADALNAVASVLSYRPSKTLDWKTPAHALDEYLCLSSKVALRPPLEPGTDLSIRYTERLADAGIESSV